jgi:hypothetical protein
MKYQIKLVPDDQPNADGKWVDVPASPPHGMKFAAYSGLYREQIPAGFHMVAIQKID